jgi:leader peptidase (prepilin peptidase)/N-methyltransferase
VLCLALADRLVLTAGPTDPLAPPVVETLLYFFFVGGLIVATFVDLEWMEIPDEVSLPGAALGLVSVELRKAPGAVDAALGAGIGYLGVQLIFVWAYERLFGRRGMGEGDAKLLLMVGAFLGWQGVLFALIAGSVQGLVVYVIAAATGRRIGPAPSDSEPPAEPVERAEQPSEQPDDGEEAEPEPSSPKIPFGPFLALGALEFLFFGPSLVDWYFGLLGT